MPLKSKQPRIEPLPPPYGEEAGEALELLGHPPVQLFRVWARRPEHARSIAGRGSHYFSRRSALALRRRELVIGRTTALCGADHEWAVHVAGPAERRDPTRRSSRPPREEGRRTTAGTPPIAPCPKRPTSSMRPLTSLTTPGRTRSLSPTKMPHSIWP